MNKSQIEIEVRKLQSELYRAAELLYSQYSGDPLELLEPRLLAKVLGVSYYEQPGLSEQPFPYRRRRMQTAGLIDRQSNKIVTDPNLGLEISRFTGAHECGHWVLHRQLDSMHRDLPLDGSPSHYARHPMEKEADHFAALFLMPKKLIMKEFKIKFGKDRLIFSNTLAHNLCPEQSDTLLHAEEKSLEREKAIATYRITKGRYYPSLSEMFRVSTTAMAIRIRELNLIEWP